MLAGWLPRVRRAMRRDTADSPTNSVLSSRDKQPRRPHWPRPRPPAAVGAAFARRRPRRPTAKGAGTQTLQRPSVTESASASVCVVARRQRPDVVSLADHPIPSQSDRRVTALCVPPLNVAPWPSTPSRAGCAVLHAIGPCAAATNPLSALNAAHATGTHWPAHGFPGPGLPAHSQGPSHPALPRARGRAHSPS